jgi:hypothetical protein
MIVDRRRPASPGIGGDHLTARGYRGSKLISSPAPGRRKACPGGALDPCNAAAEEPAQIRAAAPLVRSLRLIKNALKGPNVTRSFVRNELRTTLRPRIFARCSPLTVIIQGMTLDFNGCSRGEITVREDATNAQSERVYEEPPKAPGRVLSEHRGARPGRPLHSLRRRQPRPSLRAPTPASAVPRCSESTLHSLRSRLLVHPLRYRLDRRRRPGTGLPPSGAPPWGDSMRGTSWRDSGRAGGRIAGPPEGPCEPGSGRLLGRAGGSVM